MCRLFELARVHIWQLLRSLCFSERSGARVGLVLAPAKVHLVPFDFVYFFVVGHDL